MLLGMWLACSALMTWISIDSFNAAPRLVEDHSPDVRIRLKTLGRDEARMLLGYAVRQQAGWWMEESGNFEIAFGALFFLFLLLGTHESKITLAIALVPLALTIFQRAVLMPQLLSLGAMLDFAASNTMHAERGQLGAVRMGYVLVEGFKLLFGMALAAVLIGRSSRRSDFARDQVDAVYKPNHRHIDG
jgi:hypothetical protein